jgi:hypothetical protein
MHTPARFLAGFGETLQKESPVIIIEKNRFSPVASCQEVIVGTGKFKAHTSDHPARFSLLASLLSRGNCDRRCTLTPIFQFSNFQFFPNFPTIFTNFQFPQPADQNPD